MRTSLLTPLIVLVLAAPAAAQTVSGKVTDPEFDTAPQEVHPGNDVKSVELSYDADAGIVRGVVETYGTDAPGTPPGEGYPWFWFYADLGRTLPDGTCDVTAAGSLRTSFYTPDDRPGPSPPPELRIIGGSAITGTLEQLYGPTGQWDTNIYGFDDFSLIGRTVDCVTNVELDSVYGTADKVTGFCMGPTGQITCPVTPAAEPEAPTPTPSPKPTPAAAPPSPTPVTKPTPTTTPAPDRIPPTLILSGRTAQHIGRARVLSVTASCGAEPCTVTAGGTVSLPGAATRLLGTATADLPAGGTVKLRLKVPRAVRHALRKGRTVRAKVTVTAVDEAGNRTLRAGTIRAR